MLKNNKTLSNAPSWIILCFLISSFSFGSILYGSLFFLIFDSFSNGFLNKVSSLVRTKNIFLAADIINENSEIGNKKMPNIKHKISVIPPRSPSKSKIP
jgi:hypothetical protein